MNSPIPNTTLFNEATFDIFIPGTILDSTNFYDALQKPQREFVYFDELLTFYLSITVPKLDTTASEASKISMLEQWVNSLEVNLQSIIHDGSEPLLPPRSSSLNLSKPSTLTTSPSSSSPESPNSDTSSILLTSLNTSQDGMATHFVADSSTIPPRISVSSKPDVTSSEGGFVLDSPSYHQFHSTYNRRAPGSKPFIHPKGIILIPLRVPVAFTALKNDSPFLSLMVIVTQSMLFSASPQAPLFTTPSSSSLEESEWMPDLHDTVNILSSLQLSHKVLDPSLPSVRIQKFRSHGFQTLPPLRRVVQKKIAVQNAILMSLTCVPQRTQDRTVLLHFILENTTEEPIQLTQCLCKEADPLVLSNAPNSSSSLCSFHFPYVLKPLDQVSMVFVYPIPSSEIHELLQVRFLAQYQLYPGQRLCSQWFCRLQNPLPLFQVPSTSHSVSPSSDALPSVPPLLSTTTTPQHIQPSTSLSSPLPAPMSATFIAPSSSSSSTSAQKSIFKKRLSLTEEALMQMTKVFSKSSPFTKKSTSSFPHTSSTSSFVNLPSSSTSSLALPLPPPHPSSSSSTTTTATTNTVAPYLNPTKDFVVSEFPFLLTFITPTHVYEQDTFYLTVHMVNRSPHPKRVSLKLPNRNLKSQRPMFHHLFLSPSDFERLSNTIHSTKENLLCLENELHLKPIPPEATLTVRIQFQALRQGIHVIESLFLVDHTSCRELEIKDSLQVYVKSRSGVVST